MSEKALSAVRSDPKWYQLWYWFLRASPSYARAKFVRTTPSLANGDLPDDFRVLLDVYDRLGDVRHMPFPRWWRAVAGPQFGISPEQPRVVSLGTISHYDVGDRGKRIQTSVREHLNEEWIEQFQPTSIIAAIPVGLTKAQIMAQLASMIDDVAAREVQNEQSTINMNPPLKLRAGKKLHYETTVKYLKCVYLRSAMPHLTLAEIGRIVGLSETVEDPEALKQLTSRAIKRGRFIAENSARGIFPSYEKSAHALEFDYRSIYRRSSKFFEFFPVKGVTTC